MDWPGGGMRMTAILPSSAFRPDLPQAAAPAPTPSAPETRRRGRLLVVEDEALIAMAICQDLASLGWDIVGPASPGEDARRLIGAGALPDAAVLDINLDGKLVYPLAEWLRTQSVPFVFCSGYEQDSHPAFDGSPRVRKPVDILMLDSELRRAREAA